MFSLIFFFFIAIVLIIVFSAVMIWRRKKREREGFNNETVSNNDEHSGPSYVQHAFGEEGNNNFEGRIVPTENKRSQSDLENEEQSIS